MRCLLLLTTALSLPGLARADDFDLIAPITQAQIFLQGATYLRQGEARLPAGRHRLMVPIDVAGGSARTIAVGGARLGTVEVLPDAVADGRRYLTQAQQSAYDAWQAATDAANLAEDARLRAAAVLRGAEDQAAFLRSVGGGNLETLDAAAVLEVSRTLAPAIEAAEVARADARAALRRAEEDLRDANLVATQARIDLDATGATLGSRSLLAVEVVLDEPGAVTLDLTDFSPEAGWQPLYDVRLGADDTVTLERKVSVWARTALPMTDVAVTLSTADPNTRTAPAPVYPNPARLQDEAETMAMSRVQRGAPAQPEAMADFAAEPVIEPALVAKADLDGPIVTYSYPDPVTLPRGGSVTLSLDTQTLEARVFNRAAPRLDQTAYLMADIDNTSGEPLLPGTATLYREDARIGEVILPLVPAGDNIELAFGPQQHLRLEFAQLDNATGDRGLFFTSGTRRQDMVFRVRNLSDTAEVVEARFALPYAEEEDLDVTVSARPAPDTPSVEDRRGVAEWLLDVAPGAEVEVDIAVQMQWPEGETLIWQP